MKRTAKDDWQRVRAIFDDALRRPVEERVQFVRSACGEDDLLRAEVESLLESLDSAERFLETPAVVHATENSLDSDQRLAQGDVLLHYEIRAMLGSGGMGEVYLARDTRLNRNVAIKVLRATFLPDAQANQKLLREARAAALLEHPNICQIYEISEADDRSFIVMQYVVGTTLADILAKERMSVSRSLDLAIQIAEGLAEAHAQGIVHRDIKPANVIVTDKGQAKILDFGLAKFIEVDAKAETSQRLQSSGAVMGTVPFMSPEQLRGKAIDARTDIFSFGALFYEMLAGHPAFSRESNAETISAILNDEPDWSPVPPELRSILRECLEKDIECRYGSAADLLSDLREVQRNARFDEHSPSPTTSPGRHTTGDQVAPKKRAFHFWQSAGRSAEDVSSAPTLDNAAGLSEEPTISVSRFILATVSLAVLVLGLAGAWVWLWQTNARAPDNFGSLRAVKLVSWKSGAVTNATDFRISHDGRMIAYSSSQVDGQEGIFIKQTGDGKEHQVTKDEWANVSPLWSPDSQKIAFVSIRQEASGIYVVPTLGGVVSPLKLTGQPNISLRYWTRDGSAIYYDQGGNLYRLTLETGETLKVTDLSEVPGVSNRFFAVSPDESRIAFCDTHDGQRDIFTVPVGGGEVTQVTNDTDAERRPVWHPAGDRLFYNVFRNDFIQINVVAATGTGSPLPVTRGEGLYSLIDLSPEGDKLYYSTTQAKCDVASVDIQSGREDEVAADADTELWSDVSPDGNQILFHTNASPIPSRRMATASIMIKTNLGEMRQLASKGYDARWLPDSRHISLFRQNETNRTEYNVWIVDTVTGDEKLMAKESVMAQGYSIMPIVRDDSHAVDFSSDSKRSVYPDYKKPQDVKVVELASGVVTNLTKNENPNVRYSSPRFSRDGKQIVFVSLERPQDQKQKPIERIHIADGDRVRVVLSTTDALRLIGWSANGELIVSRTKGNLGAPSDVELSSVWPGSGLVRKLSTLTSTYGRSVTMSADGVDLAFTVNRDDRDDIWIMSLLPGTTPRKVTINDTTRQFLSNLEFTPDGKRIFFDKQEEINTISVFENFN